MKKILLVIAIIVIAFLIFYLTAAAFFEPAADPPAGNSPGPLNVGSARQSKAGDLELENLKARQGIELGGVLRTTWADGEATGCTWEGIKCYCASDSSSVGNVRITVGLSCSGGQLTGGLRVVSFDISSRDKNCWSTTPGGCDLYSSSGPTGSETGFAETIEGAVTTVTNVIVSVVRRIARFFRGLF